MITDYDIGVANLASRLLVSPTVPVNIASTKLARPSNRMPLGKKPPG